MTQEAKAQAEAVRLALGRIRELLEKGWTTETAARDVDGKPVPFNDRSAISFCLSGALFRSSGARLMDRDWCRYLLMQAVREAPGFEEAIRLQEYNDAPARTKEEILHIVARAVQLIDTEFEDKPLVGTQQWYLSPTHFK